MKKKSNRLDFIIVFATIIIIVAIIYVSFHFANNKKVAKAEKNETEISNLNTEENDNDVNNETNNQTNTETKSIENTVKTSNSKKNQKLPEWTDTAVQDIKDIYGSDEKQVFLTFDDGPSKEITPQILEILKEENVPATFFVLGKCVDMYPDLVKQEYEEGHFIANHGYTHTYSQIYSSVDSVLNEYNLTNEAIQEAIGVPEYNCHLFRFPGGSSGGPYDSLKAQAKQVLADNQIASTNWNCLTSDAAGNNTVQAQYKGALDTQGSKTSLIILMHDAADKKSTPETTKLLIQHYKEEGYEFKTFYDVLTNEGKETVVEDEDKQEETKNDDKKEENTNTTNTQNENTAKTSNQVDNKNNTQTNKQSTNTNKENSHN